MHHFRIVFLIVGLICLAIAGLGEIIGPTGNFGPLPDAAKWLLCLIMILGRLEIIVILLLLTPRFWGR